MNDTQENQAILSLHLIDEIKKVSSIKRIQKDTEILRIGQNLNSIPIVISGMIKVYSQLDEKNLLLYYIKARQSCIMSFTGVMHNTTSEVFAITKESSEIILTPKSEVKELLRKHPELNEFFFNQYYLRYNNLIKNIQHIMVDKMDVRMLLYLKNRNQINNNEIITATHNEIANDLGTAREVVSRALKKLENENKLLRVQNGIKLLD